MGTSILFQQLGHNNQKCVRLAELVPTACGKKMSYYFSSGNSLGDLCLGKLESLYLEQYGECNPSI